MLYFSTYCIAPNWLDVAAVVKYVGSPQSKQPCLFWTQLEFECEPKLCVYEQKQLDRLRLKGHHPFCSLVIQLRLFSLHFVVVIVLAPTDIKCWIWFTISLWTHTSMLKMVYVPRDHTSFQSCCVNVCSEKWEQEIRFKATTKAMSSIYMCAWEGCVWMCAAVCARRMSMLF